MPSFRILHKSRLKRVNMQSRTITAKVTKGGTVCAGMFVSVTFLVLFLMTLLVQCIFLIAYTFHARPSYCTSKEQLIFIPFTRIKAKIE